jgi:hypothetical protein
MSGESRAHRAERFALSVVRRLKFRGRAAPLPVAGAGVGIGMDEAAGEVYAMILVEGVGRSGANEAEARD